MAFVEITDPVKAHELRAAGLIWFTKAFPQPVHAAIQAGDDATVEMIESFMRNSHVRYFINLEE